MDLLFDYWKSFDLPNRGHFKQNFFSYHFAKKFCNRNGLSFRKIRSKKRGEIRREEVDNFIQQLDEVMNRYPPELIFNMDETGWNFEGGAVPCALLTDQFPAHMTESVKNICNQNQIELMYINPSIADFLVL